MKLVLNSDICDKHQLSFDETLILYLIMRNQNFNNILRNLVDRGLIQDQDGKYIAFDATKERLNKIITECGNVSENKLSKLASDMQKCFPQGKPPGSVNYYRANKREIIFQLQKFFAQYGNYPYEDIINVTKNYVDSFYGNYKYLPIITNFILKVTKTLDEAGNPVTTNSSQLATQLENKRQSEEDQASINNDSWMLTSRN